MYSFIDSKGNICKFEFIKNSNDGKYVKISFTDIGYDEFVHFWYSAPIINNKIKWPKEEDTESEYYCPSSFPDEMRRYIERYFKLAAFL